MNSAIVSYVVSLFFAASSLVAWAQGLPPQAMGGNDKHKFQLTSTSFADGGTLPLSAVWNQCAQYPGGGNVSPELSWSNAPHKTRSFVVVMYDVTATFTHWGMYNIRRTPRDFRPAPALLEAPPAPRR